VNSKNMYVVGWNHDNEIWGATDNAIYALSLSDAKEEIKEMHPGSNAYYPVIYRLVVIDHHLAERDNLHMAEKVAIINDYEQQLAARPTAKQIAELLVEDRGVNVSGFWKLNLYGVGGKIGLINSLTAAVEKIEGEA